MLKENSIKNCVASTSKVYYVQVYQRIAIFNLKLFALLYYEIYSLFVSQIPIEDITNVPSTPSIGTKCRLLHWVGTGDFVAKAEIASTDPISLVHHIPLGPDCYKVWVTDVLLSSVPLFRHSNEFSSLDDAKGSTVAWPHKYISFD